MHSVYKALALMNFISFLCQKTVHTQPICMHHVFVNACLIFSCHI